VSDAARWLLPSMHDHRAITDAIAGPLVEGRAGKRWWIAVLVSLVVMGIGAVATGISFAYGPGMWGNNSAVVWGFPIANYVWWIGIGNAGTLISALLLLTRQKWRNAINRFAEAMTILAVSIAGLFPIIHLGRPMYFYWMAPYPNTMGLWPQWRSALVWDFWAILSYLLFSLIFFYLGLIPDLATLRDRPGPRRWRRIWGAFALGWQGTPGQWRSQQRLQRTMAVIATPLVCSVHSIVGLDFAASLMPGWTESVFPPYFVVGAFFSGFAMVVLLALIIRSTLRLEAIIRPAHLDACAKMLLAAGSVMLLSYGSEWMSSLWTGEAADLRFLTFSFTGPYAGLTYGMILGNCLLPQLFWSPVLRRSVPVLVAVSLGVLVGMYFERILIICNTLSIGYEPTAWTLYVPTVVDFAILLGTGGLFVFAFLLLSRVIPLVPMYEIRELAEQARDGLRA
jgi:molybdopterin-containing oxidoreductase family membrane subunit